jgi:glycosyltransferase involved in cell wall biosynthesis
MKDGKVAYVLKGFPRLSETFIAHEIHQLERLGLALRIYSVLDNHEPVVHPVVDAIRAPLTYLPPTTSLSATTLLRWLPENLGPYWRAHAAVLRRRPLAWLGTALLAVGFAWTLRSRQAGAGLAVKKVFIKEFLQAGWIAREVLRAGDVSHLHGHFCHGVATITWFTSRLTGLPFSFTAHAKDIYQTELNPGRLLERKLGAARFVATCTCENARVLRARHPRPDEVHAIYHGLDTDWFSPGFRLAREGAPLLLAVGRLVEKKGFDRLLDACALLRERGLPFRCRIVGEEGSAGPALRARIAEHGLSDQVELQPAVAQDRLRDIYREAAVFVLPCRVMEDGDRDGFPNVLAEAMAMGVPVVSTPISGIPEMIDDGVHGLLVDGTATSLAAAIERVCTEPALRARLATAARERIVERFDSRQTTATLRDLFLRQLQAAEHATASTSSREAAA